MRLLALIAAFVAFSVVFWAGWYLLFGAPQGGMGYVALAIGLTLLAAGRHLFNRVYPKP